MRQSVLHERHLAANAVFGIYGEWEMPARYRGKDQEYQAVRTGVGLFDTSSNVMLKISGANALEFLDGLCAGNVSAMNEGRIINTLLASAEGKILAIIWLLMDDGCYYLHSDAEKKDVIWDWLQQHLEGYAGGSVSVEDMSREFGCIAIIGPKAIEITKKLISEDTIGLSYLGFEHDRINESDCLLCRYGYTGEYEYRLIIKNEQLAEVWDNIREIGAEYGLSCCGLDIMQVLMLEMKSVNQNKDLFEDTTPLQAGLHWMIYFRKERFMGRAALFSEKERGVTWKLVAIVFEPGKPVKEQAAVFMAQEKIGMVKQVEYSGVLAKDIGVAYIHSGYAWVGLEFTAETTEGEKRSFKIVSAPLFITKTVSDARE